MRLLFFALPPLRAAPTPLSHPLRCQLPPPPLCGRSFVDHYLGEGGRTSLMFTVRDGVGSLSKVLSLFEAHSVNLTRIESKPSKRGSAFDFVVDTAVPPPGALLEALASQTSSHTLLAPRRVPWFPTSIRDIDAFSAKTLDAGADLESDHPGFNDAEYRQRRHDIVAAAARHRHGEPIPAVAYTAKEAATWRVVYDKLRGYTQEFACTSYNRVFPLLEQHCGYAPDRVPQLEDISAFLLGCTGFRLRPVGGLLSARDFLNGLAFRVFFSTQYMRHHSVPLYTPEPDVCHELLGHVPMFADPDFADFSHDIGLASLGASDEDIKRLAAVRGPQTLSLPARTFSPPPHTHPLHAPFFFQCYWFSVEFGLCMEQGQRRAYGAGLLSSFGELEYSCASYRPAGGEAGTPVYRKWDPAAAATQAYPICKYQPVYFVADSLTDAKDRMLAFCESSLMRPFQVRYDPYTQTVSTDRAVVRAQYVG